MGDRVSGVGRSANFASGLGMKQCAWPAGLHPMEEGMMESNICFMPLQSVMRSPVLELNELLGWEPEEWVLPAGTYPWRRR